MKNMKGARATKLKMERKELSFLFLQSERCPFAHEHGPYSTAVIKFRWNTSRMGVVTAHQDADIKPTNKTHRSWRKCCNPPPKWNSFRMLGYTPTYLSHLKAENIETSKLEEPKSYILDEKDATVLSAYAFRFYIIMCPTPSYPYPVKSIITGLKRSKVTNW